jgi:hypothetical protein
MSVACLPVRILSLRYLTIEPFKDVTYVHPVTFDLILVESYLYFITLSILLIDIY